MNPELAWSEQPNDGELSPFYYYVPVGAEPKGIFSITKHSSFVGVTEHTPDGDLLTEEDGSPQQRCDNDDIAQPGGWHHWDDEAGVCSCGVAERPYELTNSHYPHTTLKAVTTVIGLGSDAASITYLEFYDDSLYEGAHARHFSVTTQTLEECFRLMIEWEWCYLNLDSEDVVAKTCARALEQWEVPYEVREWLLTNVPEQKVARFLSGDPDARSRSERTVDVAGSVFDEWVVSAMLRAGTIGDMNNSTVEQ